MSRITLVIWLTTVGESLRDTSRPEEPGGSLDRSAGRAIADDHRLLSHEPSLSRLGVSHARTPSAL